MRKSSHARQLAELDRRIRIGIRVNEVTVIQIGRGQRIEVGLVNRRIEDRLTRHRR